MPMLLDNYYGNYCMPALSDFIIIDRNWIRKESELLLMPMLLDYYYGVCLRDRRDAYGHNDA